MFVAVFLGTCLLLKVFLVVLSIKNSHLQCLIGSPNATCDAISNTCFDVNMKNVSQLSKCDCPMDCKRLSFSYRHAVNIRNSYKKNVYVFFRLTENTIDEGDLEALCQGAGAGLKYTKAKMREYSRAFHFHDFIHLNVTYNTKLSPDTLESYYIIIVMLISFL